MGYYSSINLTLSYPNEDGVPDDIVNLLCGHAPVVDSDGYEHYVYAEGARVEGDTVGASGFVKWYPEQDFALDLLINQTKPTEAYFHRSGDDADDVEEWKRVLQPNGSYEITAWEVFSIPVGSLAHRFLKVVDKLDTGDKVAMELMLNKYGV